jgi:hypothetical protein
MKLKKVVIGSRRTKYETVIQKWKRKSQMWLKITNLNESLLYADIHTKWEERNQFQIKIIVSSMVGTVLKRIPQKGT